MTSLPLFIPDSQVPNFYVTGGTLSRNAACYVSRKADEELLEGLRAGQFCYVLTSRQMGKSSLMVRAAVHLREEGVTCVILDLTAIGQNLDAERWYGGLLNQLGQQVNLEDELDAFWLAPSPLGPMQRFMQAVQQVVLKARAGNLVLFVDEIDAVRSLPFSADEFFAGIRQCYNHRSENPDLERLNFCLLGVATPSDLIRDTRTTPFNIGKRIDLIDFTFAEAAPLKAGLLTNKREEKQAEKLLARVLYWTGGQPYLTQRLCQALAAVLSVPTPLQHPTPDLVDHLCEELFLATGAQARDDNLIFVRERLLRSEVELAELLFLYRRAWQGQRVPNDTTDPKINVLHLSGVTRIMNGMLAVRNRIYKHVFNAAWVQAHIPDAEFRRQRVAYRQGILRAALVSLIIVSLMTGILGMALWNHRARETSQAAVQLAQERKRLLDEAQTQRNIAKVEASRANKEAQRANKEAAKVARVQQREHVEREKADVARMRAEKDRKEAIRQRAGAQRESRNSDMLRHRAERAERLTAAAERLMAAAERLAKQEALFEQARSLRFKGEIGRNFESLDALARAALIPTNNPQTPLKLRNEAIACLSLPIDLRPDKKHLWPHEPSGVGCIGVTADGTGAFFTDVWGNIALRTLADNRLVFTLPGTGSYVELIVRQSGNGRYIAVLDHRSHVVIVWDVQLRRKVATFAGYYTWHEFDFSPDSRSLVYLEAQGDRRMCAHVQELPSGQERALIPLPDGCRVARFHPTGRKIAFAFKGPKLVFYDLDTGRSQTRQISVPVNDLAWRPDGRRMAGSSNSGLVSLWDGQTGAEIAAMKGHTNDVVSVAFNHRGDILASGSWDGTLRFWNGTNGEPLMTVGGVPDLFIKFSPDDRYLVTGGDAGVQRWEVSQAASASVFPVALPFHVSLHPNGRLMALATRNGVHLWDVALGQELCTLPVGNTRAAFFSADGNTLFTSGMTGVRRWEVCSAVTPVGETMRIGPVHLLRAAIGAPYQFSCLSRDGQILAAVHGENNNHLDIMDALVGKRLATTGPGPRLSFAAISPDNRYIAAGNWANNNVLVWDGKTGKKVAELPTTLHTSVTFSPDGRWLVTGTIQETRFWAVPSWKPGFHLSRIGGSVCAEPFYSEGRLLAAAISSSQIWLGDPVTGTQFATLEWPEAVNIVPVCFNAEGSQLIALSDVGIHLWDLRSIRRSLASKGLDWSSPPITPTFARVPLKPLILTVVPGETLTEGAKLEIRQLEQRLLQSPDANTYNDLAWFYVVGPAEMRSIPQAVTLARKAVEMAPATGSYYNTLGIALYRAGRYKEALETLNESLKLNKGEVEAYDLYFLAMCHQRLGDRAQARSYYDRAVRWHEAHSILPYISPQELIDFRAEAEAVLKER